MISEAVLTYPDLGPTAWALVGQAIGCDENGDPYQILAVQQVVQDGRTMTQLLLQPWRVPPPGERNKLVLSGFLAARRIADLAFRGRPLYPTC